MSYQLNTGYLLFSHGGTGQCLTVYGGAVNNNQNVCLLRKVGTSAQTWTIKAFGSNLKIVTGLNQNYALNYYWNAGQGNPGNCDIYPQAGNDADSFIELQPVSTDVYRIKLKNYNLYLTAKGTGDSSDVRWEAPVSLSSNYTELLPQEWRIVNPLAKGFRAPLIYAGHFNAGTMYCYTDDQLQGLEGATEFVICSAFNGCFTASGVPDSRGYLQNYEVAVADMAKRLYTMYGKQVWIGTPQVGTDVPETKAVFEELGRQMTSFINDMISQFARVGLSFDTCVKGIYIADETVRGTFNASSTAADNYQISMFQTVANYAAAKGKKMLWAPHWGSENLIKAACVIHRTNIFDYALVQPSYYFPENTGCENNCEILRTGIAMQRLCYLGGIPILHETAISSTKTVIGCVMENDWRYIYSDFQQRYQTYVNVFDQAYGAYDKYNTNFGFYFGCPSLTDNPIEDSGYDAAKAAVASFIG